MAIASVSSMNSLGHAARVALAAAACTATLGLALPARADDAAVAATLKDIEQTMGGVPTFVRQVAPAALPGAWAELKAVEFSETAIPMKYKALISIAVAAQIPCQYCVWLDTQSARAAGATDAEIQEAVAIAGIDRHWSAIFNGMDVDFELMKTEFSAMMAKK